MFDYVDKKDFELLRTNFLKKVSELETKINQNATTSDEVASAAAERSKQNASVCEENAKKSSEAAAGIIDFANGIKIQYESVEKDQNEISTKISEIQSQLAEFRENFKAIVDAKTSSISALDEIKKKLVDVTEQAELSKKFSMELQVVNLKFSEATKIRADIDAIFNHSNQKKEEIDAIYSAIYGRDVAGSDGQTQHLDGLKDSLERSYKDISDKVTSLEKITADSIKETQGKFDAKLTEISGDYKELIERSRSKFDSVTTELDSLLPGAMAAGLSHAYEKKAVDEIKSLSSLDIKFRNGIYSLVGASLIPFAVDLYLLYGQGKSLVDVIKGTPNLILAILPLYFPILWFAYTTSKKVNLSKRLIEEYTHKSSLGKTFAGLSKQIDEMSGDDDIKKELRVNLLFNFLQVSSENPGKLITNYDKADHPLMEALENSAKLSASVDVLAKLPGFSALARKLAERADTLLEKQAGKVIDGLETRTAISSLQKPD